MAMRPGRDHRPLKAGRAVMLARDAMRAKIAEICGIAVSRVAVKATTSEKLGFIGRSEGMAAFATATVRLPWKD